MRNNLREIKIEHSGIIKKPPLKITVRLTVKESDGRISYDKEEPAHSWTRNFWNILFSCVVECTGGGSNNFGSGYMSVKGVNGTLSYLAGSTFIEPYGNTLGTGFLGAINSSTLGIVVGKTATAFNFEQYALASQCVNGTGTDNLVHAAQAMPTISWTGGTLTWKAVHTRIFNNNSLASISVNETGLYSYNYNFGGGQNYYMIERNVLGTPVPVGVGAQLTVTYNISLVFPN
jgi:hypothetical protein